MAHGLAQHRLWINRWNGTPLTLVLICFKLASWKRAAGCERRGPVSLRGGVQPRLAFRSTGVRMSRPVAIGPEGFDSVLAAAQSGAGWALERLWTDLAAAVAGYFRAQGAVEPDDLTSEVFLGVFTGLGRFSGGESEFRSWVFTIAHRRLTDERRREARQPRLTSVSPEHPTDHGDVEDDVLRGLATERVRSLCARLSPDQPDVLLLRLVGGLTVDEVASTVNKSPGAVKALQRRGLAGLRNELDRRGVTL